VVGLVGFGVVSAIAGTAQSFGVLVGARALQGAFGALLAPGCAFDSDHHVHGAA
jgi:hypothetical protein